MNKFILFFVIVVFMIGAHGVFAQQTAPAQTKVLIMPSAMDDMTSTSTQLEDISTTKEIDKASPMLQQPSVGGSHDEGDPDQPIIEGRVYNAEPTDEGDASVDTLKDVPDAQEAIDAFLKLGDIEGESKDAAADEEDGAATKSSGDIILKGKKIRENFISEEVEVRGWDSQTKEVILTIDDIATKQDLHDYVQALVVSDENIDAVEARDEAVSVSYRQPAKFLGLFQTTIAQTASVDAEGRVKVRFPWFAFLYKKATDTTVSEQVSLNFSKIKIDYEPQSSSGDDAQMNQLDLPNALQKQQQYLQMLTDLLKTKHDVAQAMINIVR